MRVGILGAESMHVEYFGIPINQEMLFGSARVECIWGGDATAKRLESCASEVGIEHIMNTPSEVIDNSDVVIITLRNGNLHAKYAIECMNKHKPLFIDKPFTCCTSDTLSIINAASHSGTPFTGGSTLCFLPEILKLNKENKLSPYTEISFKADPDSPYGGWFFYGSHLTDLCAAICGTDATLVEAKRSGSEVFVDVFYPYKRNWQTNFVEPHNRNSHVSFEETKKVRLYSALDLMYPKVTISNTYILSDKTCYSFGLKAFFDIVASGVSPDIERLMFSVRLMDAIMHSLISGKVTAISR